MKRKLSLLLCIITILSLTFSIGCSNDPRFSVSNTSMSVDYSEYLGYTAYVNGTLTNNSMKDYDYIQIEFSVYDSNGIKLGTAIDNATYLGAGETWSFSAMLLDFPSSRPASYKLVDISGW